MRKIASFKLWQSTSVIAAIASLSTPGNARAQDATSENDSVEEIVVTANRREQSLTSVSASVSAITGDNLAITGTDSFDKLTATVPGLTMNQATKNRALFNIRGLQTTVLGGNTQDTVSVYINDSPVVETYGAQFQPDLRLFDVERVEVLRGPQGTLYGSGALAGTVRILTHRPDASGFASSGRIDLGVTDGGAIRQRYDAMLNIPIVSDALAIRVVGYYRDEEGWVNNQPLGISNNTNDWGVRTAIKWTPTAHTTVEGTLIYQESEPDDADSWNPSLGKFIRGTAIPTPRAGDFLNANLTASHRFEGFATLSSSTTFHRTRTGVLGDLGDLFGTGQSVLNQSDPWDSEFTTQEVRLVSEGDGPLSWVVGAFYIDRETFANFRLVAPGLDALFGGALGTDDYFTSPITVTSKEVAAYADATYAFKNGIKVFGGIRIFETEMVYSEPNRVVLGTPSSFSNTVKNNDHTWRLGISYQPSLQLQMYGSVSTGFRIGQANPNQGSSVVDPTDVVIREGYDPDTTLNYEIGIKGVLSEGKVRFNLAAYKIIWSNIQTDFLRVSDRRAYIDNTGEAVAQGVELEFSARPARGLDLGLSATFQDSKITSIDATSSIQTGVRVGDRLPGSVKTKLSGFAQYTHELNDGKQLFGRIDAQYVGGSPNRFPLMPLMGTPNPFFARNEAYESIDLQIGYQSERLDAALYVENITNNDSYILNNGGSSPNSVNTLRPRTIGIRISIRP